LLFFLVFSCFGSVFSGWVCGSLVVELKKVCLVVVSFSFIWRTAFYFNLYLWLVIMEFDGFG